MAPKRATEKRADAEKGGDDQEERVQSTGKHVTKKTKVDSSGGTPRRSDRISQVQGKAAPKKPKSKAAPKRKSKKETTEKHESESGGSDTEEAHATGEDEHESKGSESEGGSGSDHVEVQKKPAARGKAKAKASAKASAKAVSSEESSSVSVGDAAPSVECKNEAGDLVKLSKVLSTSGAILFFYPKANTPGCTKQACNFRDSHDELQELGYSVYGVSGDGATAQENWKQKHKLPFHLLCDTDHGVIKSFGCAKGSSTNRSHVVIAKGGTILDIQRGVTPADSAELALKIATGHPQK